MSELKAYTFSAMERIGLADYYLKSEADKVIARHKHKRCVAMAMWCKSSMDYWYDRIEMEQCPKFKFYEKWHKRWLKLAEKFKPNSTAQ